MHFSFNCKLELRSKRGGWWVDRWVFLKNLLRQFLQDHKKHLNMFVVNSVPNSDAMLQKTLRLKKKCKQTGKKPKQIGKYFCLSKQF